MPQMVWTARPDGYLDYYNKRWYEFTGFKEGEGGDSSWQPILHPDDAEASLTGWYQAVKDGKPYEMEYRFWDRKKQRYRWQLGRALPTRDETGKILRWYGTCTDIDEHKNALDALIDADRSKDEFLAVLAHELRSPLNVIVGYAELLTMVEPGGAEFKDALATIKKHVELEAKMISDVLEVSRIVTGKTALDVDSFEVKDVIEGAAQTGGICSPRQGH